MTIQKTTTDLSTLKINYLTQEMYEDALENDEINENELYITPGSGGGDEIFYAEYNVTTYQEIRDAVDDGKTVMCTRNNSGAIVYYQLVGDLVVSQDYAVFMFAGLVGMFSILQLSSDDYWSAVDKTITAVPESTAISSYDNDAKMNSTDMTSSEIEDFVEDLDMGASGLLNMFYPVGSIYQTVDDGFNPNTRWGGTWELIEEGRFLQATETSQTGGDEVEAGLPNVEGGFDIRATNYNRGQSLFGINGNALFTISNGAAVADTLSQVNGAQTSHRVTFNANNYNSIYGNSTTVQPSAIKVYMWYRTA